MLDFMNMKPEEKKNIKYNIITEAYLPVEM